MASKKRLGLKLPIPAQHQRVPLPLPLPLPLPEPPKVSSRQGIEKLSDLERLGKLGHGSGGIVYKVLHPKSSTYHALKVIRLDHEPSLTSHITREMHILRKIDSPYIVKCEGVFHEGGDMNFVLEFMDGGSLADLLKHRKRISESCLAKVARQVLEGLKYLHTERIVHRDIKPANLLVSKNYQRIKIADFGVSRIVSHNIDSCCNSYVGTCAYMSPERFDPQSYGGRYNGYAGDIWSLGLTLLECYVGHFPFVAAGEQPDWPALMCAICFGEPPSAPASASAEFQSFIRCCLQKDAGKRWTASQLLKHPFLNRTSQFQQACNLTVPFQSLDISQNV
ncbi:hypothetical protein SUGI_0188390 [Cryptomeria japonica]|uniref:mitogen-activated protein kinase kinase 9 n=1 Tax=Cryptomeria japonica TaxID=3369 RepID=UPI002408B7E1|nr:mitogen-activated protein kinase kinase 9 [Cryptomeria japonica]GLJ12306.1 hypothetical protein SUGI_0188390 [Cryptomeria japonica]